MKAKALIMVVSRTEPVELAVEEFEPEVVGLILSQDILPPVVMKTQELGAGRKFLYRIVDSPMEIGNSFERFEHLLSELEGMGYVPEEVLLDVTGGTTPMRFGAALAAMSRNMRMVHQRVPQRFVDGGWELDPSGRREIVPMNNPLESTGLLRQDQAVQLFNRRDYAAAALVFEDILGKVSGVERRHYYGGLLALTRGYAAWDIADYANALANLRAAREELTTDFSEAQLAERTASLTGTITSHLSFLGRTRGKLSAENVVDMVENARRRIEDQGRYDDGVARLYRAVEMWHQWRLQERNGLSTKDANWEKVPESVREAFLETTRLRELPSDLDLMRARVLDRAMNGDVTEDDSVFRDLLQQRNNSILAHGLKPIGSSSARRFLEYVDAMVDEPRVVKVARHVRLAGL